jgi:hypothetical protein
MSKTTTQRPATKPGKLTAAEFFASKVSNRLLKNSQIRSILSGKVKNGNRPPPGYIQLNESKSRQVSALAKRYGISEGAIIGIFLIASLWPRNLKRAVKIAMA